MMKISKYTMMIAITAITSLTSCKKDFLELNPPSNLTPEQALATEADLQVALRGAYAGLRATGLYGRAVPIIGDVLADNAYQHSTNTNRYTVYNNLTATSQDADALLVWTEGYKVILRANRIISSDIPSSVNVDQYKGEAYAVRALAYFTLVRFFAKPYTDSPDALGIPIVTVYDPYLKPGRSKVGEVYALILDDLSKAFTMMTKFTNSSQFSKYAARALEAKVHLTMGNKASAKTAAVDVITNGQFTPVTAANYAAYWASSAIRTDKVETLFEVSSDAVGNNSFDALSYIYSQNGNYGDFAIASDLYALFEPTDVRRALYPSVARPKPSGPVIPTVDKYPVITGDYSDTKVLRLSEMYLIAAEASLPGGEADALTYVNFVTSRRNAAPIVSTGTQLFEDIITERRKELAFEGDRYHDLQRLKRPVQRSANFPAAVRTIEYSNFRRLLPIPQSETDANAEIRTQQNPGY
jgi:hypothetical protein